MAEPLVNFLIVGGQRCGSTALWHYLRQHDDICVAEPKELHFFDRPDPPPGGFGSQAARREYHASFTSYGGQPAVPSVFIFSTRNGTSRSGLRSALVS